MTKKIYCFHNGDPHQDAMALAVCEDGHVLATHICSNEYFAKSDLGVGEGNTNKHEAYKDHCPEGYELEFIYCKDVENHEGLQAAYALNQKLEAEDKEYVEPSDEDVQAQRKNYDVACCNCSQKPTVGDTELCGPCCFGEADTVDGNW